MKKLKHEAELFKGALLAGMTYAEGRKAVEFEPTDSASEKLRYIYRLLVHGKIIPAVAGGPGVRSEHAAQAGNLVFQAVAEGSSTAELIVEAL
jgi:hypothetical protein